MTKSEVNSVVKGSVSVYHKHQLDFKDDAGTWQQIELTLHPIRSTYQTESQEMNGMFLLVTLKSK